MMTATEYSHMTAGEFSREEVVAKEKEIAKAIDFQFDTCTAIEVINSGIFSQQVDSAALLDKKVNFLGMYLTDLSQLSSELSCRYSPSLLAYSSLILASIELFVQLKFKWPQARREELLSCVTSLHEL